MLINDILAICKQNEFVFLPGFHLTSASLAIVEC